MAEVKIVEVTWRRAFKVWWSFMWRATLFGFLGGVLIGFIIGVIMQIAGASTDTIKAVCQIAGMIISIPIGIAVIRIILKKEYPDFKVALIAEL